MSCHLSSFVVEALTVMILLIFSPGMISRVMHIQKKLGKSHIVCLILLLLDTKW